jgi:hypothetical protein
MGGVIADKLIGEINRPPTRAKNGKRNRRAKSESEKKSEKYGGASARGVLGVSVEAGF